MRLTKSLFALGIFVLLAVSVVAVTTITDDTSTFGGLIQGTDVRLEDSDANLRLVSTQAGERSAIQLYNGTQIMLSVECHGLDDPTHAGAAETHCGFYASNSTGATVKVFNMQWGYDVNNITLDYGNSGRSTVDFNNAPLYNLNISGRITSDTQQFKSDPIALIQDADTSVASAESILRLGESGASQSLGDYWDVKGGFDDFDFSIETGSNRWFTIDRTTGQAQFGAGTSQVNITLTSPDGTDYNCGVANGGAFSCT